MSDMPWWAMQSGLADVPTWVTIVVTVIVTAIAPSTYFLINLYLRLAGSVKKHEHELYGTTGTAGLRTQVDLIRERTHAIPSLRSAVNVLTDLVLDEKPTLRSHIQRLTERDKEEDP